MRSKAVIRSLALLAAAAVGFAQWQIARPGYHYEFPRDNFAHPDCQTEWWYYTGNLLGADGHRFGFELTFFRVGSNASRSGTKTETTSWSTDPVYLAHLALSDIDSRRFHHEERVNRAGPGLAGVDSTTGQLWNGNWQVRWTGQEQRLQAVSENFTLDLDLQPEKPLVIHGQNGVSIKGPRPGDASHYISFTRLKASGTLKQDKQTNVLHGTAWMDHEFFTSDPNSDIAGWDWFAIQLDNREELMLYRLRSKRENGGDVFSSGTYVDANGTAHYLRASDFKLAGGGEWRSPDSGTRYPLRWTIAVPSLQLQLAEVSALDNQELFSRNALTPSYWEGAVRYAGTMANHSISGVGYLEMTGYDKKVFLAPK
jgi:predicted secreted hydrolase